MKKEENRQFDELYIYVKKEILQYDDNVNLPKNLVLRLKGLRQGKFMANNNTKKMANYDFKIILLTFQMYKSVIKNSISNKDKFKNETHMINYIMTIVENKINDVYHMMKKKEKIEDKTDRLEININTDNEENNKAKYKTKSKKTKSSRLENLI